MRLTFLAGPDTITGLMPKRWIFPLIFGAMALSFSSCATQDMIAKAQGLPGPLDPPNQPPTKPNPAYYALVPLVFPFDLVAWPFEYLYMQNRTPSGPPPPNYPGAGPYGPGGPGPYYQSGPSFQPYRPAPTYPGVTYERSE